MKTTCVQSDGKSFITVFGDLRRLPPTSRYFRVNKHSPTLTDLVNDLFDLLVKAPGDKNSNDAFVKTDVIAMRWERKIDMLTALYEKNAMHVDIQALSFHMGELSMMLHWINAGNAERKSSLIRLFD
jgi:hypothetical protein